MTTCHAHVATMLRPGDDAFTPEDRPPTRLDVRRARRLAAKGGKCKVPRARKEVLCQASVPEGAAHCPECGSEAPAVRATHGAERFANYWEDCYQGGNIEKTAARNYHRRDRV